MSILEKPTLRLKLELEIPNEVGFPNKKYVVTKTLKSDWDNNPKNVTQQILNEIKNYKGSYVGDMIYSLYSILNFEENLPGEEITRNNDILKWTSHILDSLIFYGIDDNEFLDELINNKNISEWDGELKNLQFISKDEINQIDLEKLLILFAPKLKHILFLISKRMKDESKI